MSDHALSLYLASGSMEKLEIVNVPESSYVREEARAAVEAPLAIMPPPSMNYSGSSSIKTTARSRMEAAASTTKAPSKKKPVSKIAKL
jgi:hypothetical protein